MSRSRWKIDGFHLAVEFDLGRTGWGITWQAQLETGAAYPGEKVTLNLNVELLAES